MEIKTGVSLQTKQTLSQVQMESLNVLSMSMTELREFLQNEEIENPLVEYSSGGGGSQIPVTYRETERFYGSRSLEDADQPDLYQAENGPESVENLVMMQLSWEKMGEDDRKVVDFCINSLEQSGYLPIPPEEIAKKLGLKKDQVERVLSGLKLLEPRGIFASGLEECLLLQIQGMEQDEAQSRIPGIRILEAAAFTPGFVGQEKSPVMFLYGRQLFPGLEAILTQAQEDAFTVAFIRRQPGRRFPGQRSHMLLTDDAEIQLLLGRDTGEPVHGADLTQARDLHAVFEAIFETGRCGDRDDL